MLKEGDPAPDFRVAADDGRTVSLADYRGRNLVLYFFPKANTSGWTSEASEFRDALAQFEALNTAVAGCSADSRETLARFKKKYILNFPLLADTEFAVIGAYEARRLKRFLGKSFMGIVRMTFWVGPGGVIRKIWDKVSVKGHAAEVLAAVRQAKTAPGVLL
jgi:thioredoxin-dependent peroxiredoxin